MMGSGVDRQHPSLEFIDGRPSIAFTQVSSSDPTFGQVRYMRSSTANARYVDDWQPSELVFTTEGSEMFEPPFTYDLAALNDLPALALDMEGAARFYQCSVASGAEYAWSWNSMPDSMAVWQLLELGGLPAVVTNVPFLVPLVVLQRAQDAAGFAWNPQQQIGAGVPLGPLGYLSGYPVQASGYPLASDSAATLTRASNMDGSGQWEAFGDLPAETMGFAVANDVPIVGYVRAGDGAGIVRTGDIGGAIWGPEIQVVSFDPAVWTPVWAAYGSVAGRATIVYALRSDTIPGLQYGYYVGEVHALDAAAQLWSQPQLVWSTELSQNSDDPANSLWDLELAEVNGHPAVCATIQQYGQPYLFYAVRWEND
jgi:hypothetical protein